MLAKRKDLKLIVTSATMNANRFTKFLVLLHNFIYLEELSQLKFFNRNVNMDYVEMAVKQVLTIHLGRWNADNNNANDGDILVFMTGQEDIEITCDLIKRKLNLLEDPPPLDIFPIYSTMPQDLQRKYLTKRTCNEEKWWWQQILLKLH